MFEAANQRFDCASKTLDTVYSSGFQHVGYDPLVCHKSTLRSTTEPIGILGIWFNFFFLQI